MENLSVTLIQSGLHWQGIDANLAMFEEMDARLGAVRNALRNGERIESV